MSGKANPMRGVETISYLLCGSFKHSGSMDCRVNCLVGFTVLTATFGSSMCGMTSTVKVDRANRRMS
jgi:hypothetical protein